MSRLLPRAVASGGALAVALLLVSPTAAFADDHGNSDAQPSNGAGHGDPAGNNGSIKIDEPAPADSGHANRPHPGCAFQLRMFGFDDDQYGTVTFTAQAPTKGGTLLTQTHVLLSDDAAGGGPDADAVYSYTAQQLGLTGTPTAKQGWHVKVAVDADDAPGGAKQKVFWLSCPAAPTTPTAATTGTTAGAATGTTYVTQSLSETQNTAHTLRTLSSSTAGAATSATTGGASRVKAAGSPSAGFTGGSATAATNRLAGRTSGRGMALPFTGFALPAALALGLGALVAGGLAVRAGRRRTSQV